MKSKVCLFCNGFEKKYKPESDKSFICSQCVQLLLSADQSDLRRAHRKAIEKGYPNKARAIESFLIPEEKNVRETKKPKRDTIREAPMPLVRPTFDQLGTQQTTVPLD